MKATRRTTGRTAPTAYSPGQTLAGTAVVAAGLLAAVVALSYPTATVAVVALALAARYAAKAWDRRRARRGSGRSRTVCVPGTDVCVRA